MVSAYIGALAPVFFAIADAAQIDEMESPYRRAASRGRKPGSDSTAAAASEIDDARRGRVKWGSSTTRWGEEHIACTEVEGWGYGGVVGGPPAECVEDHLRRRKYDAKDLTVEDKETFIERARTCWREVEGLREQFEAILDAEERRLEKEGATGAETEVGMAALGSEQVAAAADSAVSVN
ncbi:3-keto-steroid reductase [Ascosphaera acerosa]|nr:3-keto-steroid reductase [Ascosphaera acerosa]